MTRRTTANRYPTNHDGWRPPSRVLTALGLIAAVALAVWSGARGVGETRGVHGPVSQADQQTETTTYTRTLATYLEGGQRDVVRYLASDKGRAAGLEWAVEATRSATVRIRVHFDRRDGRFRTDHGSGFVLAGGRHVVTAAHVVDRLDEREDCEVQVAFASGGILPAFRIMAPEGGGRTNDHDWAVLELAVATAAPGLRVKRQSKEVMLAAALGYPGQLGLSPDGRIVKDASELGFEMAPIVVLGELFDDDLVPHAGAMPFGGISGGPVVDAKARVVGIDTGTRANWDDDGNVSYRVIVTPTESLCDWLEENLPDTLTD